MIGIREVFRGIVVKYWVSMPTESIDCTQCNEELINIAICLYCEYLKDRCVAHLRNDIKLIKAEAMCGLIVNYAHDIN